MHAWYADPHQEGNAGPPWAHLTGLPAQDEALPGALIVAGIAPALDADDSSVRDVRAWLRMSLDGAAEVDRSLYR